MDTTPAARYEALTGTRSPHHGPDGLGHPTPPSDDLAHVAFRDFEFDDTVIEEFDEYVVGRVDQRFRDHLQQSANVSGFSCGRHVVVKFLSC